ncbi:MAG: tyrosine--tRNA ligase [Phycisphaerae bacterium]|nr:tyrosine--tRNA ligase [Phycisphaerae bacterium]
MTILQERGFVSQVSDKDMAKILEKPRTIYIGFDPTAPSLHIGNLLQIMLLAQFQRCGHRPIALVGGATGMIGDPSGKSAERVLLTPEIIQENIKGIRNQLAQFLDFDCGDNSALLVNNADWMGQFTFIDFLRDVGKFFRVGEMMGKESVRKRLNSETGMSFTEFSYQLLQGYDFNHLCNEYNCEIQAGGDDQWGNITAGIDCTRKISGKQVWGITSPLLTTASGQKFGKSEGGAIYLDSQLTSPYEFYQYFVRVDDRDVIELLKRFTFLSMDEIKDLEIQVAENPEARQAQKVLASEVTALVHGKEQLDTVMKATQVLFGQPIEGLTDKELAGIFADVPGSKMPKAALEAGLSILDAFADTKLCSSRGEAKKLIKAGGAYLNNNRVTDMGFKLTAESLASETTLVLRSGKKKYHLISFE